MRTPPTSHSPYQQEAAAQLALVEELILELEQTPGNMEMLNRLFRIFHTIKGSGSMFGFEAVANLTHHVESILDAVRKRCIPFDHSIANLTLAAKDAIAVMISSPEIPAPPELELQLRAAAGNLPDERQVSKPGAGTLPALRSYSIEARFASDIFRRGLDPLQILRELHTLGHCSTRTLTAEVPPLTELDPESCHLCWQLRMETSRDLNAIRDTFIFVEDDSGIRIAEEAVAPAPRLVGTTPRSQSTAHPTPGHNTPPAPPERSLEAVGESRTPPQPGLDAGMRVSSTRMDQLLGLVGELVINHSRLQQLGKGSRTPEMNEAIEDLERLLTKLRDNVLETRMTPIGTSFGRLRRLVRDLSAELGREVELITEGEETELDKNVLDRLGEPLIHLLRNAVDHGISTPKERLAEGKPAAGRIHLSATHCGSSIVISISDDGRGLDTGAIRFRAVEQGLLDPAEAEALPEEDLHQLIFHPGFSTARNVTAVSGRGVGMDVVKRQLEDLRGTATLRSERGKGTCVTLALPLTLAIIEGLLVEAGGERYILPLSSVEENLELARGDCATGNGRRLVALRGDLIPYVRLRDQFGLPGTQPPIERIVVVRSGNTRYGMVVDRIHGTHQTVVQSLGRFYREARQVSGATILGDGHVALILDVGGVATRLGPQRGNPRTLAANTPPNDARPATATSTGSYLSFHLGEEVFAMEVSCVREILDMSPMTPVPDAPPHMLGVINVRGSATAVLDLRTRLGLPSAPTRAGQRIIVMDFEQEGERLVVGGLVDAATGVFSLEADQLNEAPSLGMDWDPRLIRGTARSEGRHVIVLDMPALLSAGPNPISFQTAKAPGTEPTQGTP